MYKRTLKAILKDNPDKAGVYIVSAQFGEPQYRSDISFTIPVEINSTGAYALMEIYGDTD